MLAGLTACAPSADHAVDVDLAEVRSVLVTVHAPKTSDHFDQLACRRLSKGGVPDPPEGGQTDPAIDATSVTTIGPIAGTTPGRPIGSDSFIALMS